jgi:hypothetical protein
MTTATLRSDAEIEKLKRDWFADPCWDIEHTDGFEAHREELVAFRQRSEAEWERNAAAREARRQEQLRALAEKLGCPGNILLAEYVTRLEERLTAAENRLEAAEAK